MFVYFLLGTLLFFSFVVCLCELLFEKKIKPILVWCVFGVPYLIFLLLEFSYIETSIKEELLLSKTVDGIDIVVSGAEIVNLNSTFGKDIEEGQKIIKTTETRTTFLFSQNFTSVTYSIEPENKETNDE